jgi:hypothetical protein
LRPAYIDSRYRQPLTLNTTVNKTLRVNVKDAYVMDELPEKTIQIEGLDDMNTLWDDNSMGMGSSNELDAMRVTDAMTDEVLFATAQESLTFGMDDLEENSLVYLVTLDGSPLGNGMLELIYSKPYGLDDEVPVNACIRHIFKAQLHEIALTEVQLQFPADMQYFDHHIFR